MIEEDYFNAIAERFLLLRGAPLCISPADFQILDAWWTAGIPLTLAVDALEKLFAKRAERGERGSVGLRYCAPAVEEAWDELRELVAPGIRGGETMAEAVLRLTGIE